MTEIKVDGVLYAPAINPDFHASWVKLTCENHDLRVEIEKLGIHNRSLQGAIEKLSFSRGCKHQWGPLRFRDPNCTIDIEGRLCGLCGAESWGSPR